MVEELHVNPCTQQKNPLRCNTRRSPIQRTYLNGELGFLCSVKVAANWLKKWKRATRSATARTAKATVCTGPWLGKHCITVERNITFDTTVLVQQDVMAEGKQDTPGIGQNPTPTPMAPSPDTSSPDLLWGFEPEAEGCGHHIWKLSAYVHDIQEGQGVSSTHRNDPVLPCRLQQPSHTLHHATMAILKDGTDNELSPIEYSMIAATHAMGRDPVSISDMKKNTMTGLNGTLLSSIN